MRKINSVSTLLICFLLVFTVDTQAQKDFVSNTLIVKLSDMTLKSSDKGIDVMKSDALESLHSSFGLSHISVTGNKKKENTFLLEFEDQQDMDELIHSYEQSGLFDYVEPNFIAQGSGMSCAMDFIPNDDFFHRQWGLFNNGTFSLMPATEDADIDMELAWDIERGNSRIKVAVLDSGIKLDHPEFGGRIWENSNESPSGTDSDGNGYIDDVNGWDFVDDDSTPLDEHGHGTNVAGILGANGNNGIGYSGVDMQCKIMALRVLDNDNNGLYSWMAEAMYYAVDHGAKVINMSLGGSGFSNLLKDAADYAYERDVIIVASMMNFNNSVPYYPAAFDNVMAVGSTNSDDNRTEPFFWDVDSGSCYGGHIDVVAPGNFMYGLSYNSNTNYNTYWGGTSQATPLVSGLCALMLAQNGDLVPDEIRSIIRDTAEDEVGFGLEDKPGFDIYYGYGRVNAFDALLSTITSTDEIKTPEPEIVISPNPASEMIQIQIESYVQSIFIIDMTGKKVVTKYINQNAGTYDIYVSGLNPGLYLVNLHLDKGMKIISEKVLVGR